MNNNLIFSESLKNSSLIWGKTTLPWNFLDRIKIIVGKLGFIRFKAQIMSDSENFEDLINTILSQFSKISLGGHIQLIPYDDGYEIELNQNFTKICDVKIYKYGHWMYMILYLFEDNLDKTYPEFKNYVSKLMEKRNLNSVIVFEAGNIKNGKWFEYTKDILKRKENPHYITLKEIIKPHLLEYCKKRKVTDKKIDELLSTSDNIKPKELWIKLNSESISEDI